jgi:TP901 family phage tail tape measure protein
MGKQAMAIGGVMVAASGMLGYETVKMASAFQTQMERVHTQAGASQAEVDSLSNKVLALAGATGQGPEKLAEALYHVESVGYRGAAAMSVLNETAKLATISGASLDETTYGLTSVMQSYGAKAQDAAKWAAFFNGVVGVGDMRMQDFVKSVGTGFFSAAQTFGVSAQSAGAALAFMTDRGQHADSAATHLRMSIALMAAPSAKATSILKGLGLSAHEAATQQQVASGLMKKSGMDYSTLAADLRKPDGFLVALQDLKKHLTASGLSADAANAQLSHAFGGGKSDSTILAMLNNLGTLKSKYDALGHAMGKGNYADSWAASQKTFAVETAKAKAALEAFGIQIGNVLMPYVEKFVGWLAKASGYLTTHAGAAKAAAIAIGVVFVAGLVIATAGMLAFAIASIAATWEILLIIGAIMLVVAGVYLLATHWGQVWGWIKDKTGEAAGWVRDKVVGAWDTVRNWTVSKWNSIVQDIKNAWNSVTSWISGAWHTVTDPIVNAWNTVWGATQRVWGAISGFFRTWWPLLLVIFDLPLATLIALWNHFHTAVWNFMVSVWNKVSAFFKVVWGAIVGLAKDEWKRFHQYILDPVVQIYNDVVRFFGMVGRFIALIWGTVVAQAARDWNSIYNTVVRWLNAILAPVSRFGSSVISMITGAFNTVLSWLGGVGSWFYNVGANIVQGIINGIGGAAGGLFSSLQNLASGALSAAKSFLGINSPSRVFADHVGRAIPEGIAKGINDHAHMARSAVQGLSGSLLTGGSSSFALAGAGAGIGGGSGTINLNLVTEAKVDGNVLFRTTQTRALKYQKQNGRQAFAQ